jgi:hypothetical protein
MADWYVSSVAYTAIPQWQASTAYTVGQIIRPVTPLLSGTIPLLWTYRCTVAGTSGASEPNWASAGNNNSTLTSGGATFTNVAGQSTYGWSAAAGSLYSLSTNPGYNRIVVGDRAFVSSDHSESATSQYHMFFNNYVASHG